MKKFFHVFDLNLYFSRTINLLFYDNLFVIINSDTFGISGAFPSNNKQKGGDMYDKKSNFCYYITTIYSNIHNII